MRIKCLTLFVALIMLLALCAPLAIAEANVLSAGTQIYTASKKGLAVYGRDGAKIGALASKVVYAAAAEEDGMLPVYFDGGTGYVFSKYVKASKAVTPVDGTLYFTSAKTTLRKTADSKGKKHANLVKGAPVIVTSTQEGGFASVFAEGKIGFIATETLAGYSGQAAPNTAEEKAEPSEAPAPTLKPNSPLVKSSGPAEIKYSVVTTPSEYGTMWMSLNITDPAGVKYVGYKYYVRPDDEFADTKMFTDITTKGGFAVHVNGYVACAVVNKENVMSYIIVNMAECAPDPAVLKF